MPHRNRPAIMGPANPRQHQVLILHQLLAMLRAAIRTLRLRQRLEQIGMGQEFESGLLGVRGEAGGKE